MLNHFRQQGTYIREKFNARYMKWWTQMAYDIGAGSDMVNELLTWVPLFP